MSEVSLVYPADDRAVITIERPATLNSLDVATLRALREVAGEVAERSTTKVVVLRGRGRAFSSGVDLSLLDGGAGVDPRLVPELGRTMVETLDSIPAVTVAVLRGAVVGGGLVLAAACDLRVAAEDTYFSIPEVDLGLPVGWGGVPRMVREIGPALTKELIMTCRPFTAREARDAGFVNRVVPAQDLDATVDELVSTLCAKPRYALLAVKQSVAEAAEEMLAGRGRTGEADMLAEAARDAGGRRAAADYMARYRRARGSE
ncbi:MAG: enoyl-CoA hydratase/isomerase family protein [bacterium]|nr:enoyl-CoA hydratase/isomerase family protein [bacterium]MDE0289110.1 enoyl-CoA hydratase/isomerase family protein [bacterium]MDE0440389.1 enoyl-CoA hydratase/isomerase family protein [bacterium]